MKCKDCEHFRICYEPLPDKYDWGRAECRKHGLIVDFLSHHKINKLECIEEANNDKC